MILTPLLTTSFLLSIYRVYYIIEYHFYIHSKNKKSQSLIKWYMFVLCMEIQTTQKVIDFKFLYYFQHCPCLTSKIYKNLCFNRVHFRKMRKHDKIVASIFFKAVFLKKKLSVDKIKLQLYTSGPFPVFRVFFIFYLCCP